MLLAWLAAAALQPPLFRHGEWSGRCWRGGHLEVDEQEHCLARRDGALAVTLSRTGGALAVRTRPRGCRVALAPRFIGEDRLIGMRRDVAVVLAIEASARTSLRACHSRAGLPDLDTAALHDVMIETDDLLMADE